MRENASVLLDLVGILVIAAGITGGLWPVLGPWALVVGGCILLLGSWLASRTASSEAP